AKPKYRSVDHSVFMYVMACVELTLASSSFNRLVTGLGVAGPRSCPSISCSAVVRAASVGAGEIAVGAEESAALPPVPVCPQTRPTLINMNRVSRFAGRVFISRNYRDYSRSMQLHHYLLHSISGSIPEGLGTIKPMSQRRVVMSLTH